MAFARYKGEAEKALLAAGLPRTYIFRPAYIYPAFRMLFPNQVIRADDLARAMVGVAVRGKRERESVVFENREIRDSAESLHHTA
jgi:hypothetical protein